MGASLTRHSLPATCIPRVAVAAPRFEVSGD